ncbi:hypothetical protein [Parapedobacter sp. 2B3]|uniref:hypothetical protein n=1 Tax=Parapedobacter sp. 2B3 TaxID=3342381 RepID=UPI0035B590EE
MFKWLGKNIGYILNPLSLIVNPPNKAKNDLQSQAKKNLEKYIAETGKPPPTGTLLAMQGTQPVGSILNFGGFSVSNDANNPLKGQTGMAAFVTSLDKSKGNMNVSSVLSPEIQKANSLALTKATKELEIQDSKEKVAKVDKEILETISPTVTAAGNSGNNGLAIAGLALLGLFFIAK